MSSSSFGRKLLDELKAEPDDSLVSLIREHFIKGLAKFDKRKVSLREGLAYWRIARITQWLAECIPSGLSLTGLLKWRDVVLREPGKCCLQEYEHNADELDEEFLDVLGAELKAYLDACGDVKTELRDRNSTTYALAAQQSLAAMRATNSPQAAFRLAWILTKFETFCYLPDASAHSKRIKSMMDGYKAAFGDSSVKSSEAVKMYFKLVGEGVSERDAQKTAGERVGVTDRQVRRYLKDMGQS